MASATKRRTKGSKASDGKRKRKNSGSDEDGPAFLSSKYAERPTSKIYNSRFNHTQPAELFRKDLISAMKLPDNEPLVSDDYWLIEDSWKPEWERGVQVPVFPEALPQPDIRSLRKRSKEATFKLPKKLIRFTRDSFFNPEVHVMSYTNTLAERTCRYDMDDIDLKWLTTVNQDREDFGLQPLEETFVEQVIEEFEVQAYVNFQEAIKSEEGLGVEYDEDAICDVCRSPDSHESNEMVFCDSCNICVHQICYGITKIPEGSWICRTCALGIRPPCVLCPNRGGAMKTIRTGQKWAHVGCAVWIPEVSFLNFVKMEPIIKISQVPASRWSLVCTLCNEKSGACITCSEKGCKAAFHVTCAFNEGLQMRASVKVTSGEDDELKAFCQKHSQKKFSIFSDSEEDLSPSPNKKDSLSSEERANLRQQKIQEKEAEFYNYVNIEEVSELFQCDKAEIETIFYYWKLKRKSNLNRQFLTPKIDTENNCTEENSPISFLKKMVHHRQDLERARNLCYMVIKREKQVKRWTEVKEKIFFKQLEILRKEGKSLSDDKRQAVLDANLGDIAYDKKFSGMNGPSPNMVSVLTNLVGEELVKTQMNGLLKGPSTKKSERGKQERTPNPYAKHYLNGLVKRSQRWFPVNETQNKSKHLNSSSLNKSNQSLSSHNSTNHVIHKVKDSSGGENSLKSEDCISENSDIKDISTSHDPSVDSSVQCDVNSELTETKESISASFVNDISKDTQDSSSANHLFDVSDVCNISDFDVSEGYNISDVSISEVYNMSDLNMSEVYNLDSLVCPLVEVKSEGDSLFNVDNSSNAVDSSDSLTVKMEVDSDSDNSSSETKFTSSIKPHLKNCDTLNFNGKTKIEKSKLKSRLTSASKRVSNKNSQLKKLGVNSNVNQEYYNNLKDEIYKIEDFEFEDNDKVSISDIKSEPFDDYDLDNNAESKYHSDINDENMTNNKTDKCSDQSIKSKDSKNKFVNRGECNTSSSKITIKNISTPTPLDIKKILDNSRLKVSLNRNLELEMEQNNVKLNQPFVVLKSEDRINCEKSKSYIQNCKAGKISKCTEKLSKKTSNIVKPTDSNMNCGKSLDCPTVKSEDKSELKFRPMSSKNSPVRTQSPTPVKPTDNVSKFKSSPKHNTHDKNDVPSKSFSSKHRNSNISSPTSSSSSVNKHPSSPLAKCQEKNSSTRSDIGESKEVSKDKQNEATVPRKDILRGYKIPKKPRLTNPEESSGLDQKRGSTPLSPLPNITASSSVSSYQTNHTNGKCSWRKLEPRSEKPPPSAPCNTWATLNGEAVNKKIVMTLKKDKSDPKSQRWLNDSTTFNRGDGMQGWMGDFVPGHIPPRLPPLFSPPLPPFQSPVQWAPMRSRGGFSHIHRNYRPGPYT